MPTEDQARYELKTLTNGQEKTTRAGADVCECVQIVTATGAIFTIRLDQFRKGAIIISCTNSLYQRFEGEDRISLLAAKE